MAEHLARPNVALALLADTIATGAALVALMIAFGPISGASFNPASRPRTRAGAASPRARAR
jgi:glycerol uptake facilitator-like aquaporin